MPEIQKHLPGSFCWAEVATVEPKKTQAFYRGLFDWAFEDMPAGEFGTYTMCKSGGNDLAGLCELPPDMRKQGVRPHWMSYIAVENADATCKSIVQHGGKVQQGPFDVMEVGRMAVCQDPTGAMFSLWQPKSHKGAGTKGEKGTPCWFELSTKGVAQAEAFYKGVFGWSVRADADGAYREFSAAGATCSQGGMMELRPEHGPLPPHWRIYFTSADCDGDAQRSRSLGGKVIVPPMDIPKVGRFAVLADPAGASFAIIKLAFHGEEPPAIEPAPGAKKKVSVPASKPSKKK